MFVEKVINRKILPAWKRQPSAKRLKPQSGAALALAQALAQAQASSGKLRRWFKLLIYSLSLTPNNVKATPVAIYIKPSGVAS